jgi:UDP-N-acetyl-D-galactosamine dehydrogenase
MGITFKENVTDIRNTKVIDIISELNEFGVEVDIIDPNASAHEVKGEYNIELKSKPSRKYDAIIIAVNHKEYMSLDEAFFEPLLNKSGLIVDVKGILKGKIKNYYYWSL